MGLGNQPVATGPGPFAAFEGQRLLAMARDRSIAGREALASAVSAILGSAAAGFSATEQGLMNDILRTLIRDVERSVRQTLAASLATADNVPYDVITALANDEIEVAYPLLTDFPALSDPDLQDVIQSKSSGHRIAIAMRREISTDVSDTLIESGDVDAVVCLLNNNGAKISETGFENLLTTARQMEAIHAPLTRRPDLSNTIAESLASIVSEALRASLSTRFNIPDSVIAPAAKAAAKSVGDAYAATGKPNTGPNIGSRSREIKLMIESLRRQEWPQFEAAMVRLTSMPPKRLRDMLYEPGGERLAVLCKSIGISKSDFASIYVFSRKASPSAGVVDADAMQRTLTFYDQISQIRAEKALARWNSAKQPTRH